MYTFPALQGTLIAGSKAGQRLHVYEQKYGLTITSQRLYGTPGKLDGNGPVISRKVIRDECSASTQHMLEPDEMISQIAERNVEIAESTGRRRAIYGYGYWECRH